MEIKDIKFREDLYPRFEVNQRAIEKYSQSIEKLPPILVNQNNILIDGFHRWKAHLLAEETKIKSEVVETKSEKEVKQLAYQYNSNHGLQLSNAEKKKYAQEMTGNMSVKLLSDILSVSGKTISRWTKTQQENLKKERNRKIVEYYLRGWNTQQSIADILDVPQQTITRIINTQKGQMSDMGKEFNPFIYNIWNIHKADKETSHFGYFPEVFMENLLYYHTESMDLIFDPFAGSGTTVDVCKKWLRRYYCSDIKVKPGREKDIKQHNILNGFPDDLQKPDMIFLDPPYMKLARNEYSEDEQDLGNMTEQQFNEAMSKIANNIIEKKIEKIAYVIRPLYDNLDNKKWIDPIYNFDREINKNYELETRYVLPYSTEQYRGSMVKKAKEEKTPLVLNRELNIYRRK